MFTFRISYAYLKCWSPRGHVLGLAAPRGQYGMSLALALALRFESLALAIVALALAITSLLLDWPRGQCHECRQDVTPQGKQ